MTGCARGHEADRIEIRPNGARVCMDCRADFEHKNQSRNNTARRVNTRNRALVRATPYGSTSGSNRN